MVTENHQENQRNQQVSDQRAQSSFPSSQLDLRRSEADLWWELMMTRDFTRFTHVSRAKWFSGLP
jgi:hypothetical protein